VWWCTPIISAFERLRQEDCEFKAGLGYIARPGLKNKTTTTTNRNSPNYKMMKTLFFLDGTGV
jgi:hypothetical protein